MSRARDPELIVIGAGAAGLYSALCAARVGAAVTLVSATPLAGSASYWAQGGLAAAVAAEDSPALHLADTVAAGRGSVRISAARVLCDEAPQAVHELTALGLRFDADRSGALSLGLEGGHRIRRVVHAGGAATGRRLIRELSALVAEHPGIEVREESRAVAILTADGRAAGVRLAGGEELRARATVLATGGAAAMWARTTNPAGATGGGLLLAHRAGAALADLELMQFHPTAVVAAGDADGLLVTEAVRGEGAQLLDERGERFVDELAPRDEVARTIQRLMVDRSLTGVQLDMREVDPALFPNVVAALRGAGFDPEHGTIPVAPAAHYMMGGIATDLDGRTSLAGLYAVGECSCTGLHGANRLASNSLTECFVFGARAARAGLDEPELRSGTVLEAPNAGPAPELSSASRTALWRNAGLERDAAGLRSLAADPNPLVSLVAVCALSRRESRGAHQRSDFPAADPGLDLMHTTVRGTAEPALERWE